MINSCEGSYVNLIKKLDIESRDSRMKKIFQAHNCWIDNR